MSRRVMRLFCVLPMGMAAGCAGRAPGPSFVVACPGICSEGSTYSPALALHVTKTVGATTISIDIDSGTVHVPGTLSTMSPTLMEHLYIRAFVAVDLATSDTDHAWRPLAWSDSILLADALRYGERRHIPRAPLRIPVTAATIPNGAWLGFAITGDAVNPRATEPGKRLMRGGVRVFVCDPAAFNGSTDLARVERLRQSYTAAC